MNPKILIPTVTIALGLAALSCSIFERKDPRIVWEYEPEDKAQSINGPVALGEDGTIYFSVGDGGYTHGADTNDWVCALNPDGTLKWSVPTPSSWFSAPAVGEDGTVYMVGGDGILYAVSDEGTIEWTAQTSGELYWIWSPSIGPDGTVYAATDAEVLYAFDPHGLEKWSFPGISRSLAVGKDGSIYGICEEEDSNYMVALDPDGTVRSKLCVEGRILDGFALDSDGNVYFGTWNEVGWGEDTSYFYAVSQDSSVKWRYPLYGGFLTGPVIGEDGTIYVCAEEVDTSGSSWYIDTDGYVYALSPDGELEWKLELNGSPYDFQTPAVGSDGTIYVAVTSYDGGLYAISPSGNILWEITSRRYTDYFYASAPAMASDGTLYITGGTIQAIETDSDGLADSPWPKFAGNAQNTGRAR